MIYTITAFVDTLINRTFGYFTSREYALKSVEENSCDIHECYYPFLVIEAVPEGIHPEIAEEIWFKWNKKEKKWNRLPETPKGYRDICNWAMG